MKYIVEVTFTFDDIEADSEEQAQAIVDGCFTSYVHHPTNNNMVNPDYSISEEQEE
jgi:hypothetical protein